MLLSTPGRNELVLPLGLSHASLGPDTLLLCLLINTVCEISIKKKKNVQCSMSVWDVMWYYYFYFSSTDSTATGIDLGAEDEHRNKRKMGISNCLRRYVSMQ